MAKAAAEHNASAGELHRRPIELHQERGLGRSGRSHEGGRWSEVSVSGVWRQWGDESLPTVGVKAGLLIYKLVG